MTVLRTLTALALGFHLGTPAAAQQQDARPGIAVLAFENGGSYGRNREDYDALRRGVAGILISELSQNPRVRLVDRAETQRILDEQALAESGRVDAATAARIGRLVGARYMITGTFIDLYGEFRLDARVIDVETSEILATVRNDPKLKDVKQLHAIIQSVAQQLLAHDRFQARLAVATPARRDVPTEALILYSRALLYEDRGDRGHAIEYYQKALDQFPDFTEAQEGLRKVRGSESP
ncbi:MAG TPA: CsgG/HfaB family protein [Gemmatimonadales bacterium]